MWFLQNATLTVNTGNVNYTDSTGTWGLFGQRLPGSYPSGTTLTVSVHCKINSFSGSGSLQLVQTVSGTTTVLDRSAFSATGEQTITVTAATTAAADQITVQFITSNTSSINVDMYEWKLELGNISTLRAGDRSDPAIEAQRCAQWLQVFKVSSIGVLGYGFFDWQTPKNARITVPVLSTKRANPTVTVTDSGSASFGTVYFGTYGEAGASITVSAGRPGMVYLFITVANTTNVQQNMPCVWGISSTETCVMSWEPSAT